MLQITSGGSFDNTNRFLDAILKGDISTSLDAQAQRGVEALSQATPEESGLTAESWSYKIDRTSGSTTIWWINTHVVDGFNVAIGLQYGHGTGTGGYVQGEDYINGALKPIFDEIADAVWKEVQNA